MAEISAAQRCNHEVSSVHVAGSSAARSSRARRVLPRWLILPIALALVAATPAPVSLGNADATRVLNDIKSLTVPAMEGRGDDTKGLNLATRLIERRYKSLGLEPAGSHGFLQPFSVITGAKIVSEAPLEVTDRGVTKRPCPESGLRSLQFFGFRKSHRAMWSSSATAPPPTEFGYDDYAGIDVKGKIVVVLRYEPAGLCRQEPAIRD